MYNPVSTADIFKEEEEEVLPTDPESEGEKAATVLAMKARANESFIVTKFIFI